MNEGTTGIQRFRLSQSLTQEKMAQKLTISLSFYKKLEAQDRHPSMGTLKKFKKIFPYANIEDIFLS